MRIGFVGAGTVGTALAVALSRKGYTVGSVASRNLQSAERLASLLNEIHPSMCAAVNMSQQVAERSDLVFITTPDDAIVPLVNELKWRSGQFVVHCSGSLSNADLVGIAGSGVLAGGLHPLQSFASVSEAIENLPGSAFGLEGSEPVLTILKEMTEQLGGTWVCLRPEDKVLYHAAAVMASNYTVALMKMATDLWQHFGVSRPEATEALLPLLQGTVNNIARVGLPGCLTGPIARGDYGTVEKHLKALERSAPDLVSAYRAVGVQALDVAIDKGKVQPLQVEKLRVMLNGNVLGDQKPVNELAPSSFASANGHVAMIEKKICNNNNDGNGQRRQSQREEACGTRSRN